MNQVRIWKDYFRHLEFAYNNDYHYSLKMSLLEVLYGWKLNLHVSRDTLVVKRTYGSVTLEEMEGTMTQVHESMKAI